MRLFLIVLVGACMASLGTALAEPIVTASHTMPPGASAKFSVGAGIATDSGIIFDNREAQTFTTTVGGKLNDVSFNATKLFTNVDLRVSVTSLVGGQPGPVFGTVLLDVDSFGDDYLYGRIDSFNAVASYSSQDVQLDAGSQYAIVFSTDTAEANYRIYGDRSGYAGGTEMDFQNSGPFVPSDSGADLFFQVTVIPVPEPGTAILAALGVLGLCLIGIGRCVAR